MSPDSIEYPPPLSFISPGTACSLFEIVLKLFNRADINSGKAVILDEAHKVCSHCLMFCDLSLTICPVVSVGRWKGADRGIQAVDGKDAVVHSTTTTSCNADHHLDVSVITPSVRDIDIDASHYMTRQPRAYSHSVKVSPLINSVQQTDVLIKMCHFSVSSIFVR
jgi:hypothetical protein